MNRRAFLFASLAASAAGTARAANPLQVVYVGGQDCPPCRRWSATYRDKWLASPEYRQVVWTEVEPPHLAEAYQERHWPEALRPVLAQVPRKSGTPRFLIVDNGRIVSNEMGVTKWLNTMAELRKLLGEQAS
ncbi:MAG: hypothetical protein J0J01_04000 [Reyranella sp.]|uniref:hypothetical protein n=1 Tax=Reyranella sp. TaxID=1929291 RepID=UPI001AC934F8|nr:hypothetical protein [Reyranella sp.]MBN9086050.1 hypothetical protein [Reyranella sp.]